MQNDSRAPSPLWLLAICGLLLTLTILVAPGTPAQAANPQAPLLTATPSLTPTVTPTTTATPTSTTTPTSTPTSTATSTPLPVGQLFLPVISGSPRAAELLTPMRVQEEPPIDFVAARAEAQADGLDLAFNKIGFHVGIGGNRDGLQEALEQLNAAGVPFFLKTANDAEPVYKAQLLAEASGVDHTLVYRDARPLYDQPLYVLPPAEAAAISWQLNRDVFPPELDPTFVWMETTNEPDRTKSAWLAEFALAQAELAVAEGVRYAAFGWSNGEPEPEHWETPEMLAFLAYAAQHPDNVAVALHEYSFSTEEIGLAYPFFLGRFQRLFQICDENDIPRPTVLITEWGWAFNDVPSPEEALEDINWASWLYAAYPQVKGAAIWYLGEGGGEFGSIADRAQPLIAPITDYTLRTYYLYQPGTRPIDPDLLRPQPPTNRPR